MEIINANLYSLKPERYTLVSGSITNAPKCPFGNIKKWVGFDLQEKKYVRFTKSVYKKLLKEIENNNTNN